MHSARSGFTLVELMITVAILGAIAALGFSSLPEAIARQRTRAVANQVYADVVKCRSLAVSTGEACVIQLDAHDSSPGDGGDGTGAYTVAMAGSPRIDPNVPSSFVTANFDVLPIDGGLESYEGIVVLDDFDATLLGWGGEENTASFVGTNVEWNDRFGFNPDGRAVYPSTWAGCDQAIHLFIGNKHAYNSNGQKEFFSVAIYQNGSIAVDIGDPAAVDAFQTGGVNSC